MNKLLITWSVFCLGASAYMMQPERRRMFADIERGDTLAWATHVTGQDPNDWTSFDTFESVAVVPGDANKPSGDLNHEDNVYVVVERGINNVTVKYVEMFTPLDWGDDPNWCWFVDAGGDGATYQPGYSQAGTEGTYPTLQVADGTFATQQADPGLTQTTPVSSLNDLQDMQNDLAGNYYLTADIDASATSTWNGGEGFDPIGDGATPFTGTFDGGGYTISNLTINRPTINSQALFGYSTGKIANVTLSNPTITGRYYVAPLVGLLESQAGASGLVQNCHIIGGEVKAQGTGEALFQGGCVGIVAGSASYPVLIYDCTTSCTVDHTNHHSIAGYNNIGACGGFGGDFLYATVSNCRASGDVSAHDSSGEGGSSCGGFAYGIGRGCTISDCAATGNVSAGSSGTGGFAADIGVNTANTTLVRCSAQGTVTATVSSVGNECMVGGFAAQIYGALNTYTVTIQDCYTWSTITATSSGENIYAGVFSPDIYRNTTTVDNCYGIGTIDTTGDATPVEEAFSKQQTFQKAATVTNCFWDTEASGITASDYVASNGHVTSWMKTQSNYEAAGWDFNTVWEMTDYSLAVEVAESFNDGPGTHLDGESVCVYADAIPRGTFTMDGNDIADFNEADYTVVIAGLNYFSIYESLPLTKDKTRIVHAAIDFYESLGANVGVSYASSDAWRFSSDGFATQLDPVTEIKFGTFPRGWGNEPVLYIWNYDPTPTCIRGAFLGIEIAR